MSFSDTSIKFTVDDSTLLVGLTGIQRAVEGVAAKMGSITSHANMGAGLEKQVGLIDTLKTNWIAFSAAAVGAWMAVNKTMEIVELGAKAQQAEESFRLVAASSGIAADALLANLDRAAAGTVDDSDLMQSAVKGMILGLDDTQLTKIMEGARIAARYAGTDVKTAFTDITNAIGTDMPRALRRYGIITREEASQVQAAVTAGVGSGQLLAIVLAHMAVNTAKFGEAQRNAAEGVQIFKATVNELWETLGKGTIKGLSFGLAGAFGEAGLLARQAAAIANLAGAGNLSSDLTEKANQMMAKRNALLGVTTEADKKASEASDVGARAKLKQAQDVLAAEQAKVKAAAEWGKTSTDAIKAAEEGIKAYEEGLKAENAVNAEAIAGRDAALAASFKARSALGQTSMLEEIAELTRLAELQWQDKAKRIQGDAAVQKATMDMTTTIFEHEKTMGMKSLQDEIEFQRKKTAAYVEGSPAKMKALEAVYTKEQELRDKSNSAALGLIGQAAERLKARGIESASRIDVELEIERMQREQGRASGDVEYWAKSGTFRMGLDALEMGYRVKGTLDKAKREGLGDATDIFQQGAASDAFRPSAGPAPFPAILGENSGIVKGWSGATDALGAGIESGLQTSTGRAFATFDTFATKLTERANEAGSQIAQTFYANMEDWFVRKLMGQAERA